MSNSIHNLVDAMLESEATFKAAAGKSKNRNWSAMFEHYAKQRREFAQQLHPFEEESEELESAAPTSLSNCTSTGTLLEELLRSGNRTAAAFRKAISTGKLGDATAVVREQSAEVEHSLEQLQTLLEESADAPAEEWASV